MIKKLLSVAVVSIILFSCEEGDNTIDFITENEERGAILRTVEVQANSIPIAIQNGVTETAEGAGLSILLEYQDAEEGDLLQSMDVYATFTDDSEDQGDSDGANFEEVFIKNVPASEFIDGPFGLPRYELEITAAEMLEAAGITADAIFGGDIFTTRLAANLTDGRVFSTNNAGGIITGGFFASPFQYATPVVCDLPTDLFVGEYLLEEITPYVDGPTFADGSVVTVEIGDTDTERLFFTPNYPNYCSTPNDFVFQFVCGEIVVPTQESNCACSSGADYFGPADVVENYDTSDDTEFFITFLNDTLSDCAPPAITTYKLTKQ